MTEPIPPLAERLREGFAAHFGSAPAIVGRAPGRVNLIGEHTDYNDGWALPIAISRETQVALNPSPEAILRVAALDLGETDEIALAAIERHPEGGWRNYVRGVLVELARAGVELPGGDMAIAGDIARGTGLSSSASLEVAVAAAVLQAVPTTMDEIAVALLAQRAECDFVGVLCGNLDQIAAAAARRGHALLLDCRSLAIEHIRLPADTAIMIVQSGVARGLLDGEYNARRSECERAACALGVAALRDADEALLERHADQLDPVTYRRARHVIGENSRTLAAAAALADDDWVGVGELLRESHRSQAEDFEITVPATDRLAGLMNRAIGAEGGARQTGGGFGGAVIGFMRNDRVDAVRAAVLAGYRTPGGDLPDVIVESTDRTEAKVSR